VLLLVELLPLLVVVCVWVLVEGDVDDGCWVVFGVVWATKIGRLMVEPEKSDINRNTTPSMSAAPAKMTARLLIGGACLELPHSHQLGSWRLERNRLGIYRPPSSAAVPGDSWWLCGFFQHAFDVLRALLQLLGLFFYPAWAYSCLV
jgi:hypothetical protein